MGGKLLSNAQSSREPASPAKRMKRVLISGTFPVPLNCRLVGTEEFSTWQPKPSWIIRVIPGTISTNKIQNRWLQQRGASKSSREVALLPQPEILLGNQSLRAVLIHELKKRSSIPDWLAARAHA